MFSSTECQSIVKYSLYCTVLYCTVLSALVWGTTIKALHFLFLYLYSCILSEVSGKFFWVNISSNSHSLMHSHIFLCLFPFLQDSHCCHGNAIFLFALPFLLVVCSLQRIRERLPHGDYCAVGYAGTGYHNNADRQIQETAAITRYEHSPNTVAAWGFLPVMGHCNWPNVDSDLRIFSRLVSSTQGASTSKSTSTST